MRSTTLIAAAGLWLFPCSFAAAQIVPPAPPPAEKTPPYQRRRPHRLPVVQPPPRPDPEPEAPLPSIVKRDADGNLIPIDGSVELAAVMVLVVDDATRANVQKQLAAHEAEMDQRVRDNISLALQIHKARAELAGNGAAADLAHLQELAKNLKPLRPNSLPDRLLSTNTITARQRQQAELIQREYSTASTESLTKQSGGDVQKTISLSLRRAFVDLSGDADRSLQRQVAAAAPKLETLLKGLDLTTDQQAKIGPKLRSLAKSDAKTQIEIAWDIGANDLTPDQLAAVLKAAAGSADAGAAKP